MLPAGYIFVDKSTVEPSEVLAVRKSTGWAPGEEEAGWLSNLSSSLAVVCVREETSGELVGIGFLVGNSRHAILCDFNVRPEHQGKGLGRAILAKRIEIIKTMKIPFIYTSLDPSNPLRSMYEELGFESSENSYFWNRLTLL